MFKTAAFLILLTASLFSAQTTFTVKEWLGVSRTAEPVSGGIAFPRGAVPSISQLALFEGATEVPAQFYPLVTNLDGTVQWVLVDFTTALGANAQKTFTLKTQAPSASASPVISVTRNGSVITIDNGSIAFSFDTVDFKGVESLVYESKNMISGAGGVSAFDLVKGDADTNGPVTSARFIYLGDMRATYRVEGDLYKGSCGGLGYAYTMTTYANSPRVIIDVAIRNSVNAECGRIAKISYASAAFNLGFDPARTVSYDTTVGHMEWMYGLRTDTLRNTRAYEDNGGTGLIVTEKWGGGSYENFLNRTTLSGRRVETEIIRPLPDTSAYGTRPGNFYLYMEDTIAKTSAAPGYVYYLLDYAHKSSIITLECYNGTLSQSGLRTKMMAMKHRLVPLQAAADLSASEGLSIGKFGTLEDEQACHAKWGWQPSDPLTGDAYHRDHKIQNMRYDGREISATDCAPYMGIESHYDIEMDYLQGWLLQWVRYGKREYFDFGEAYGRFWDNYYMLRTTGFTWDGEGSAEGWGSRRTEAVWTPASYNGTMWDVANTSRVDVNWGGGCHFFMTGLTDYYCLTGDPDALDACRDGYEMTKLYLEDHGGGSGPVDTADSDVDLGARTVNRKLNFWIRYYEITKDPAALPGLRNFLRAAVKSKRTDPYFWQKSPWYEASWHYGYPGPFGQYRLADTLMNYLRTNRLGIHQRTDDPYGDHYWMVDSLNGNETWPISSTAGWMSYWLVDALENWLRLFPDDEDVRDNVIGFANYITAIKDGYCGLDNYDGVLADFPRKGMHSPYSHFGDDSLSLMKWDTAHARCATAPRGNPPLVLNSSGDQVQLHNDWSNSLVLACQAAGFKNTGHSYFLNQARHIWGWISANYPIPGPEDEKAKYAQIGSWEFYHNDQLTKVVPLFYEELYHADTMAPEAVADLSVSRLSGNAGLSFGWTAPAGGAVSYQLKYFKGKPPADWPDYDYSNFDTTKVPWWYAHNAPGEPAPSGAGAPESFQLSGSFPTDSIFYAALCSRDTAGNLSRLSNVVRIDNTIGVEAWDPGAAAFALCAFPNPFNPAVSLKISLPKAGVQPMVSIFDAAGRLVWRALPQVTGKKAVNVVWQGKNLSGAPVGSGVYFIRLTAAGKEINRKIVMVR